MLFKNKWLALVVVLLTAGVASAQVPPLVNPTGIEFLASPDHDATLNGTPIITRYTLDLMLASAPTAVLKTVDLGKPPAVVGKVTWTGFEPIRATLPVGSYIAIVKAEGPGGTSRSVPSDPFSVTLRVPVAPGKLTWK